MNDIGDVWKKYPDLRLGQLLLNCIGDPMLYYVEDDKLVTVIKDYYNVIIRDSEGGQL